MRSVSAAAIAGCLSAAACGPAPRLVRSEPAAPGGRWGATRVVEELRIGEASGPDERVFDEITFAAMSPTGVVFVSDGPPGRQSSRLRSHDGEGRFLRWVRRGGETSGAWRIDGLEILPGGRLAVWDLSTKAVSLFSGEGDHLSTFEVELPIRYGHSSHDLEADLDGNLYVLSNGLESPGLAGTRSSARDPEIVYLRYAADGRFLEGVPVPRPDVAPGVTHRHPASGYLQSFNVMTVSCWSYLGYLVTGRNDAYEIEVRRPEGTIVLTRDVGPAPVGAEERSEWQAMARNAVRRRSDATPPPIPMTKPYFRDIRVGDEGRIWVRRYVRAEKRELPPRSPRSTPRLSWLEPPTFDVFDPDGTFLGTVVLPDDTRLLAVRGMRLWVVNTDEARVERLVRLRVDAETPRLP